MASHGAHIEPVAAGYVKAALVWILSLPPVLSGCFDHLPESGSRLEPLGHLIPRLRRLTTRPPDRLMPPSAKISQDAYHCCGQRWVVFHVTGTAQSGWALGHRVRLKERDQ